MLDIVENKGDVGQCLQTKIHDYNTLNFSFAHIFLIVNICVDVIDNNIPDSSVYILYCIYVYNSICTFFDNGLQTALL